MKLLSESGCVTSVEEVLRQSATSGVAGLTRRKVRQIMTSQLGLKFKRMKTLATRANSICCLYQRQQFALKLISLMMTGKRVLNIDEASISQTAFIRKGWGSRGKSIRHITKPLGHRLTLTAALDTDGRTYFAVS